MDLAAALRILRFGDHFPDVDRALALVGFVRTVDERPLRPGAAGPTAASGRPIADEEDEPVWSEALDGWMVLPGGDAPDDDLDLDEPAPGEAGEASEVGEAGEAGDEAAAADGARGIAGGEAVVGGASRGLAVEVGDRPRVGDTRPAPPRVIAHVLAPLSSAAPSGPGIAYRSVPEARVPRRPEERPPHRPDEDTWRIAAECGTGHEGAPSRQVLDLAACVRILAQARPVERLPLRPRGARRATQTLLHDIALANGPFGRDVEAFVAALRAHRHGSDLDVRAFSGDLDRLGCGAGPVWTWRPLDLAGLAPGSVVVVTHLEQDETARLDRWLAFAAAVEAHRRGFVFVDVGGRLPPGRDAWPGTWFELPR